MIALKDNLPLVQFPAGPAIAFDTAWLTRSLARAARRAGLPKWWLAKHVAESVCAYLVREFEENILEAGELADAVRRVLKMIGYKEVAAQFEPLAPAVSVSLPQIARDAGSGYELAFFEILGRRIEQLVAGRATHVELCGLERCVKQLSARKCWSRSCEALRGEIVSFVRERIIAAAGSDREIQLLLT